MGEIGRVVTTMTGFTGAPGYSAMHFFGDPFSPSTADDAVSAVRDFWQTCGNSMGGGWHASVNPDVQVLDEETGALIRVESTSPPNITAGGDGLAYAAGVGAVVTWNTAAVHGSKQLRGRTFLVPLAGAKYENNGTILSSPLTDLRAAAATLAAVANFGVWGRPVAGAGGEWAGATGGTIRDHVAWLSSRRD